MQVLIFFYLLSNMCETLQSKDFFFCYYFSELIFRFFFEFPIYPIMKKIVTSIAIFSVDNTDITNNIHK